MPYRWDISSRRYRAPDGRFISDKTIALEREKVVKAVIDRNQKLAEQWLARQISLPEFQISIRDNLRGLHTLFGSVANGGLSQMSPAALGKLGSLTRFQYERLNNLFLQVEQGRVSAAQLKYRLKLYSNASRNTYIEMEKYRERASGVQRARRVLNAKESCSGCAGEAAEGFKLLTELKPNGYWQCQANCRCGVEFEQKAA